MPLPVPPAPHGWDAGSRGGGQPLTRGGGEVSGAPHLLGARPHTRDQGLAHLHPFVGKEGLGVGLGGQVQTGGPAPDAAAAHQQGEGTVLAVAVALGEEACWRRGRHGR